MDLRGGEVERGRLRQFAGYSATAQCTGMPAYLEPNSGSLHGTIEGVYRAAEKIEDRSRIGEEHNQKHVEKQRQAYLEPNRNRMHKPIEGLLAHSFTRLIKRGVNTESNSSQPNRNTKAEECTSSNTRQRKSTNGNTRQQKRPNLQRKGCLFCELFAHFFIRSFNVFNRGFVFQCRGVA